MEGTQDGLTRPSMKPDSRSGSLVIRALTTSCISFQCLAQYASPRHPRWRPRSCCICLKSKTQNSTCLSWDVRTFLNIASDVVPNLGLITCLGSKSFVHSGTVWITQSIALYGQRWPWNVRRYCLGAHHSKMPYTGMPTAYKRGYFVHLYKLCPQEQCSRN